jgi:copper(I)-binding protein
VHRSGGGSGYPRRILIAVAAALIPMIAGCEAGTNAPSLHWHQPTDGTFRTVGDITISNAFVLGAPIGDALLRGENAGLFLGLVNTGTRDRLVSVTAPGTARSVLLPGSQITLGTQHAVLLTGPRPTVILQNLLRPLAGGSVVTITLTFAVAGQVTIKVPVMPRSEFYTTLLPAPGASTPPATPTPSPAASGSASPSASPSPTSS